MRSTTTFLLPSLGFIAICSIPFAILLIQRIKQRRMLKKAGVSPETPGCANCLYIMRGWESSICPECGKDVWLKGVRIDVTLSKLLKVIAAFWVAVLIIIFILIPLRGWLFETSDISQRWNLYSTGAEKFSLRIQSSREQRRFPALNENITLLMIESANAAGIADLSFKDTKRIEYRTIYFDRQKFRILSFRNDDKIPTDGEIANFLGKALGKDASALKNYATEISGLLKEACKLNNTLYPAGTSLAPSFQTLPGGGISQGFVTWPLGYFLFLVIEFLVVILLPVYIFRRHKPGTRPVYNGEWLSSSGPDNTTN